VNSEQLKKLLVSHSDLSVSSIQTITSTINLNFQNMST